MKSPSDALFRTTNPLCCELTHGCIITGFIYTHCLREAFRGNVLGAMREYGSAFRQEDQTGHVNLEILKSG